MKSIQEFNCKITKQNEIFSLKIIQQNEYIRISMQILLFFSAIILLSSNLAINLLCICINFIQQKYYYVIKVYLKSDVEPNHQLIVWQFINFIFEQMEDLPVVKDRFFVVPSFKSQRFKRRNFVCLTNTIYYFLEINWLIINFISNIKRFNFNCNFIPL